MEKKGYCLHISDSYDTFLFIFWLGSLFVFFFVANTCMAHDHIILRNGQEKDVKLYQINDEKIVYSNISDKKGIQYEIPSKDVYMVYIEKQGNVYITPDGKRLTGESKRVDSKKYDVIYLIKGGEIAGENVRITETDILYSINKATGIGAIIGYKGSVHDTILNKSDVFMIRYRSGMIDVITPIETVEQVEETNCNEKQQPEYKVVFHSVVKGETLSKVAIKYDVTSEQLIEWNDLSSNTKPTAPLTAGMQLMIYQPK